MSKSILLCVCICLAVTINAQTINLHGKISDQSGKPISGAIVSLESQDLKDTSKSDGTYSIFKEITSIMPLRVPKNTDVTCVMKVFFFSLAKPSNVKIRIFDKMVGFKKNE